MPRELQFELSRDLQALAGAHNNNVKIRVVVENTGSTF